MDVNSLFPVQNIWRDEFLISTEIAWLDIDLIHQYLSEESYWAAGISRVKVERSIQFSLCFGVFVKSEENLFQVGFARVVSDFATFAYLADVFILVPYQGQGLGKWLVTTILQHPELQGLRRWTLRTADAHGLYAQFGFEVIQNPERQMDYQPISTRL